MGTKFSRSSFAMDGWFRVASRTMMPLPQTKPRTLPVLTTRKMGLFSFVARARASVSETSHRGLAHGWLVSVSWLHNFFSSALKTSGSVSAEQGRAGVRTNNRQAAMRKAFGFMVWRLPSG